MYILVKNILYRSILPNTYFFADVFKFLMHKVTTISDALAVLDHYMYYLPPSIRIAFTTCYYYILENYVLPLPPIKLSVNKDNLS